MSRRRPKTARFRKYQVTEYQKAALRSLMPPEDITVSECAERYRMLNSKTSDYEGPWKNDKTPYLVGIMDEMLNYETEEIVFCKPSQVGGTEAILNILAYIILQDQAPAMVVYPSDTLADSIYKNRILPMILASPALSERYHENESTISELQFDGMYLSLTGSNSPANLASKAIRFLFLDEVDKYPGASRKEADPISLARERTKTFHNRKIFITSTPTLKTGHIWKELESCDVIKHYFVPCPHCGKFIELKWSQITFPNDESMSHADRAEFANYACQECGAIITDQQKPKMLRNGEWRTIRENTKFARKVGFWINTIYSPFVRFSEIAKEFLKSKDDPDTLQNFVNSWLAEPWEDTRLKTSADLVLERQTDLPELIVPAWAKLLTAGVDVQKNCLYWTIRAWGNFLTSQNIAHGQAFSFGEIENIMNLQFEREGDGQKMVVELALIDSGDDTDNVYDFCALNSEWAVPCKGSSHPLDFYTKISTTPRKEGRPYNLQLVIVDGEKCKDAIAGRMMKPNGKGSWMVYQGCDREYAEQVTAEHKVNVKDSRGHIRQEWKPKASKADNHYLDCEVYALAAAEALGARTMHLNDPQETLQRQQKTEPTPPADDAAPDAGSGWLRTEGRWI